MHVGDTGNDRGVWAWGTGREVRDATFQVHIREWEGEEECQVLLASLENLGCGGHSVGLEEVPASFDFDFFVLYKAPQASL